ncbi:MAG: hypothetical protein JRI23_05455 [Deltaproteobacteria bacterium]|jgi:hypothetical protein|nr:hypothetical protein [Deltaproteobacteria bacterium]MBW2530999.1 hypothetical protein [Deltaproteobacteria bacterium]
MRFTFSLFRLAAVLCTLLAVSCSSDRAETDAPPPVQPPDDVSIRFDHGGTLTLSPGETKSVRVVADPPGPYEVAFYLVGDSLDASLSESSVVSDPYGQAAVALRAPNGATYFGIRASLQNGPSAELPVAVSDKGFGTLEIAAVNPGPREVELWVANAVAGTTCEALAETLPEGPAEAPPPVTAEPGEPLRIEDVPVGPNLAVFVRAGHYMWGCADEPNLVAGQSVEVEVHLVNKPIDLSEASLEVVLDYLAEPETFEHLLDDTAQRMVDGMLGGHATEAAALLTAMSGAAADGAEFDAASTAGDWPTGVETHFASLATDLSDAVHQLADDGVASQPAEMAGRLETVDPSTGYALFTLERTGTVIPADAGVPAEYLMTLSVDPDDTVRLGGGVFWMPSRHVGAAMEQYVAEQHPSTSGVAELLAQSVQCADLASALGGYGSCNATCMEALCVAGLEAMWSVGLGSSASVGLVGAITLQASGAARFDDGAALTGFEGSWLGSITNGLLDAKVQGVVSAREAEQSPAQ